MQNNEHINDDMVTENNDNGINISNKENKKLGRQFQITMLLYR